MKLALIVICYLFLSSCTSTTGEVSIFSVNSNKKLDSPLVSASELHNSDGIIYKTNKTTASKGDDTFSVYLTDSYLRYLPDIGGVNEVIIVVQFEEVVTGTASDTVTKILGPYDSIADATKTPYFHKALYGPKRMESDILSMSLKIYEYDLEENGKVGSMLDFIATASEALSLSNPVTSQEIKVAKEVAKSITNTNDNDLILQLDVDFVAGNSLYNHSGNNGVNVLPLKAGEMVLIKKESCGVGQCYDYFSQDEGFSNPIGYLADWLLFPVNAIAIGLTDSPASKSLTNVDSTDFTIRDEGLSHNNGDGKPKLYRDKTWLRLSILKGGDPSLWDKRKLLYPVEADISKLLRTSNGINSDNLIDPIESLNKVRKQLKVLNEGGIKLVSKHRDNNIQYILSGATNADLCIDVPESFSLIPSSQLYDGRPATIIAPNTNYQCFSLLPPSVIPPAVASFTPGTRYFQVNYKKDGQLQSYIQNVKVIDKHTLNNTTVCQLTNNELRITTTLNHTDGIMGVDISGTVKVPSIDKNILSIDVRALSDKPSVKTIFGKTAIPLNGINAPHATCT
ncbi:hypothetical protein WNY51_04315 [Pseudocolwellia sp. AS88]|uniref:hypothetical protein n=1 Tax=Pseudocolwellia sp. AS88 TaxID=3063958 RepID=UPI0026EF3E18|nr:hypothetical protein [Pseudocolwellia sp. AS88]MDO7086274.1 hypothetical protein [Pseudocolwellia sp. AS88]